MKSCPVCKRTYVDDAYTFCLDDGSLLSDTPDPYATRPSTVERKTTPPAAEIVQAPTAGGAQPSRFEPTLEASKTLVYGADAVVGAHQQPAGTSAGGYWLIAGGVLAFALVGLVAVLGYVAWRASGNGVTEPSKNASTAQANSSASANANTNDSEANDPANLRWLDGVWEGKGYQTNPKSTWSIRLTAQNEAYIVEYPSLSCKGRWNLIEKNAGKARFKEIITEGLGRCENNGTVLVEKIDDAQISFKYSSPNTTAVTSTAVLRKKG